MYWAIRDALLARLTGRSMEEIAAWYSGKEGLRIPVPLTNTSAVGNMTIPNAPYERLRQVSVFPYDIAGRDSEVWPSVSVYAHQMQPRNDASYIYKDDLCEPVPGTKKRVTTRTGHTFDGYGQIRTWPHGRPYDYVFRIRLWCRDEGELLPMQERVVDLLDMRGYLSLTLRDGRSMDIDTELTAADPIAVPPGMVQEGGPGEFSTILTYRCEGYRDTTLNKTTHRTIQGRTVELGEAIDDAPFETIELDSSVDPL